jgi:hypothetical protein
MADLPLPAAEIKLEGRTLTRGHITNDYGNRVHWKVLRDGVEIATIEARSSNAYTFDETVPGMYEIVLETWKHEGYQAKSLGKYIEISNKLTVRV